MVYPLSRALSAATAAYGVFALVRPGHLAAGLQAPAVQREGLDRLATTYGVRDVGISAMALTATSPAVVTAAMLLRIVGDVGDAAILSRSTDDSAVRTKVLAVTLGWAAANTVALLVDRRRA